MDSGVSKGFGRMYAYINIINNSIGISMYNVCHFMTIISFMWSCIRHNHGYINFL